jgi:hypothetical protein
MPREIVYHYCHSEARDKQDRRIAVKESTHDRLGMFARLVKAKSNERRW